MAEQDAVQEGETPEEDVAAEEQPRGEKPPVDWEAKSKAHYAQLKEAKEQIRSLKEQIAKTTPKEEARPSALDWREAFQLKNEGYSESEILVLGELAESMKKPVSEIVKIPLVKSGIESERSRAKESQAVPLPSYRTSPVEGKTLEEVIKNPEEFKKNFSKIIERHRRK